MKRPVSQHVAGKKGIFNVDLVERKTMNVQEFQDMAENLSKDGPTGDAAQSYGLSPRCWSHIVCIACYCRS